MTEPTLYTLSRPGRRGVVLPECDVPEVELPADLVRGDNGLPEISQLDLIRHFQHLAQMNFGVDSGFYPLGSCTMKFNPKVSEVVAKKSEFADTHPLQPVRQVQGNLRLMHELQLWLQQIGGFDAVSLQPAAGAQGELSALLMIRAWHRDRGEDRRNQVLIPDSAHGTNPASTSMAGLEVLQIPSNTRGTVDLNALKSACNENTAGIMITNPNTLGLFEDEIEEVSRLVHECGGLVYGDGANMNALTGVVKPAALGIDLMHYNLHKTFATPHGGGGPGAGPLAAKGKLAEYLPGPVVTVKMNSPVQSEGKYEFAMPKKSIGRVGLFHGNFGMVLRAYAFIRLLGEDGLRENARHAVLNANYLRVKLKQHYPVPYDRTNLHEFVCQGIIENSPVRAVDISKRLLDYGFHPPTNYFPLIVKEALMIEPTETESKQTLDAFIHAMKAIAEEARNTPELVLEAPHTTPVRRLDETQAARNLILKEL